MEPVLSHLSALEYWRSVRVGSRSFRTVQDPRRFLAAPPRKGELADPGPWWLTRPLHVLVGRMSSEVVCHVESADLPVGSILDTRNGFCVCSPELCFVQMANVLGLEKLIALGFELCGTYDTWCDEIRECAPLTTVERLRAFTENVGPVHGSSAAIRDGRFGIASGNRPRHALVPSVSFGRVRHRGSSLELPNRPGAERAAHRGQEVSRLRFVLAVRQA